MSWKHLGGCKPKTASERFNVYAMPVPEAGCWLWLGPTSHNGYGRFKVNGRSVVASRYSWETAYGPIPPGHQVCHKCDTPSCVNPLHLFTGTAAENELDKMRKGRQSKGASHNASIKNRAAGERGGMAKLSSLEVAAIRSDNRPQRAIAASYGVTQALVSSIKLNKIWRNS